MSPRSDVNIEKRMIFDAFTCSFFVFQWIFFKLKLKMMAEALALLGWFSIFEAKGRCHKTKTTFFLFVLRSVLQTDTFLRVITIKNKKRMYHKSTINMISNEIPSFSLFSPRSNFYWRNFSLVLTAKIECSTLSSDYEQTGTNYELKITQCIL